MAVGPAVHLRNANTGELVCSALTHHTSRVNCVAFGPCAHISPGTPSSSATTATSHTSPVGTILATGGDDCTVRLYAADTLPPVPTFVLTGHVHRVACVAIGPSIADLPLLVASGSDDETVRLWDADTGLALGAPLVAHTGSVPSVAFAPCVTGATGGMVLLASAGGWDATVRLWDVGVLPPRPVGVPMCGHTGWVYSVAFGPWTPGSRLWLASASHDKSIRLWDVGSRGCRPVGEPLLGHSKDVRRGNRLL